MKKAIITLGAVAMAAYAQAASVQWSTSGLKDSTGGVLSSGAVYIFTTKGSNATTIADVTAALAAITSADDLKTYLTGNSLSALKGVVATGGASVSGVDLEASGLPAGTSGVQLFGVVVDDDSFSDNVKYVVTAASSKVKTPAADTTNVAIFSINASATATASNWTAAAPEPTSGLLLVLGMAGLALKRKRA